MIEKYKKLELNTDCVVGIVQCTAREEGVEKPKKFSVIVESESQLNSLRQVWDILPNHPETRGFEIDYNKLGIKEFIIDAIFEHEEGDRWHLVVVELLLISGKYNKAKMLIKVPEIDENNIYSLAEELSHLYFKEIGLFDKVSSSKDRSDIIIVLNNEDVKLVF